MQATPAQTTAATPPAASAAASAAASTAAVERPLRIALLGYRSNPWSGGQGVYLKYLSRALKGLGHQVDVLSGQPYPDLDEGIELIKVPGLNLFEAPNHVTALRPRHMTSLTDFHEWFSMLTGGFAEPWAFGRRVQRRLAHASPYDIIHDNQTLAWGTLALQQQGLPLVTTIHHPITADLELALAAAKTRSERLLLRRWHAFLGMQRRVAQRLRHIVTVSERSRRDIAAAFDLPPERIRVVHNGIDASDFAPRPDITRKPAQIIATASADAPLKGLDILLRAFRQVRDTHPDARLLLIGSPKPGGNTERLIEALGIGAYMEFRHGITTAQLCELYAESTLAVVPSLYEGFGLPAGEAMACAVPVVASDGGALPEVVGDAGVTVPAGNAEAMAAAIRGLLDEPERRRALSNAGQQRIHQQFSWEQAAREMTRLYVEAAALK